MKHTLSITLLLVAIFFCAQLFGLIVTNQYIDQQQTRESGNLTFRSLPYHVERPPVQESTSFVYIIVAILIATVLIFVLMRFRQAMLWKLWFFFAVVMCMTFTLAGFISPLLAILLSIALAIWKIWRPNVYIHNLTEVMVYPGLAAIFVPVMNVFAAFMMLLIISVYDFIAVWKSGHMITLAKFQTESKVFAGLLVPYKVDASIRPPAKPKKAQKIIQPVAKNAVLGGGDIGFPLIFAGVVMKGLVLANTPFVGFLKVLAIPICATLALLLLLLSAEKDKFYPAMPFITAGCVVGYLIVLLIGV